MEINRIDPRLWDGYLDGNHYSTCFHTRWWLDTITAVFGGEWQPLIINDQEYVYLLPVMTGLPWSNTGFSSGGIGYGGILPADNSRMKHEDYFHLISGVVSFLHLPCSRVTSTPGIIDDVDDCYTRKLHFSGRDYYDLAASFSTSVRNAIRKSSKMGVTVRLAQAEDINNVTMIINQTQRDVGSNYLTPKELIQRIHNSSQYGVIVVAEVRSQIIACSVYLKNSRELFHLFNGWCRDHALFNANYAITDYVINHYYHAHATFNFGESHTSSIDRSKAMWGAEKHYFIRNQMQELI